LTWGSTTWKCVDTSEIGKITYCSWGFLASLFFLEASGLGSNQFNCNNSGIPTFSLTKISECFSRFTMWCYRQCNQEPYFHLKSQHEQKFLRFLMLNLNYQKRKRKKDSVESNCNIVTLAGSYCTISSSTLLISEYPLFPSVDYCCLTAS
jgi:hypothetical protein